MKSLFLVIFLCTSLQALPQSPGGMVLVDGFQKNNYYEVIIDENVIRTNDSLAKEVIQEFFFVIDQQRIAYQKKLKYLKGVFMVDKTKGYISDEKRGSIYIGDYVNKYPYTKRILILNRLAIFFGARTFGGSSYNVLNRNFILNEKTESVYSSHARRSRRVDMNYIIEELEKRSPLNTRIK